jgi:signal transduction histidine kinase
MEDEQDSATLATTLVIDEDDLSLRIIAKTLRENHYRVLTADSADVGFRCAKLEQPNLIITNLDMPGTDSTKLISALKERAPEACVIAMTEYGAEQLAANALKQGAEDYLIRPPHPWEITTAAAEVLERAELRRRNRQLTEALRERQAELELRNAALEEANARLREADLWKQNLASMIMHDLRNPLGVIQGTMSYFQGTVGDDLDEKQAQLLESAMISADRALKLVGAILDVHRLEEGRLPLELQPIAPDKVIRGCLDESYPLLAMHELTAIVNVPDGLPPVQADRATLVRVFANLIDNAAKFTPAGGRITIGAQQVPGGIQFSVADTGYGIPPDQHERVFEKFAQAGIRADGQRAGVGLGLTFCRLAVEAQSGRIWVESEKQSGATFHFVLPIWVDTA